MHPARGAQKVISWHFCTKCADVGETSQRNRICQKLQPRAGQGRKESERLTKIAINRTLETDVLFSGYVEENEGEGATYPASYRLGERRDYHFHSAAVDELLCSYTVDFINEPLLVRKETIQLFRQFLAHADTELVSLIEAFHNWKKGKKK